MILEEFISFIIPSLVVLVLASATYFVSNYLYLNYNMKVQSSSNYKNCSNCNGDGIIINKNIENEKCSKCSGRGKIKQKQDEDESDWIIPIIMNG